jgi:hypothetical protein
MSGTILRRNWLANSRIARGASAASTTAAQVSAINSNDGPLLFGYNGPIGVVVTQRMHSCCELRLGHG